MAEDEDSAALKANKSHVDSNEKVVVPDLGPEPILLSRTEVDTLYDLLQAVTVALDALRIPYVVTGGSLLGAVRQQSILFTDDDVDIAILRGDTSRNSSSSNSSTTLPSVVDNLDVVRTQLPALLGDVYQYAVNAWEGSDRVRHVRRNSVFLDVFALQLYQDETELRSVLSVKKNGQAQTDDYVQGILQRIHQAAAIRAVSIADDGDDKRTSTTTALPLYPCWHFDRRKAIELWPREVYRDYELLPIQSSYSMGPLVHQISGPYMPLSLLYRAFGRDCFDVYYQSASHVSNGKKGGGGRSPKTAAAAAAAKADSTVKAAEDEAFPQPNVASTTTLSLPFAPHVQKGGTWEGGTARPLHDEHYIPMQPVSRVRRRYNPHSKQRLLDYIALQTKVENDIDQQQQRGGDNTTARIKSDATNPVSKASPLSMTSNTAVLAETLTTLTAPRPNNRTVYMDGVFDLFHVGHVHAIQQCANLGQRVIIGVCGDADAASYKRPPIISQADRVALLAAMSLVDKVICPCPLIVTESFLRQHDIDLVVHGFADDADADRQREFFQVPMDLDKFQRIDYCHELSTTDIINKIQSLSTVTSQKESATSSTSSSTAPSNWFGATLAHATDHAPDVLYDPFPVNLRVVIEPHLVKARAKRQAAIEVLCAEKELLESQIMPMVQASSALVTEGSFSFATDSFPLRDALLQCGGWAADCNLAQLHGHADNKTRLCRGLTSNYLDFQCVYDDFVRTVCAPRMFDDNKADDLNDEGDTLIYYQAFPCLRIVQPGEFSIGPHADIAYGHHAGSINFYVPLTAIQGSAASLFVESRPGSEDWHPILKTGVDEYGTAKHFAGALCLHWTTENTTNDTRVSLDFRLIEGRAFDALRARRDSVYKHGYYSCCRRRRLPKDEYVWERVDPHLLPPDARAGFPWTVKDWDAYVCKGNIS